MGVDKCFFYDTNFHTGFSNFYGVIDGKAIKLATRLKLFKSDSVFNKVRESMKPIALQVDVDSEHLDKEIQQDPENPIRYMFYNPLLFGDRFLGILVFGNTARDDIEFNDEDKAIISRMGTILADVLAYRCITQEQESQAAHQEILRETFINLLKARLKPQLSIIGTVVAPKRLHRLSKEVADFNDPNQMTYLCKMFQAIYHFDWDRLKAFLLCCQIAHNDYPYHNIETTYHMCRTVYCIIERLDAKLKPYERTALMIAAISLYCGHNGLSNTIMLKTNHPLTHIYKTYMKENHRVWMLRLLLEHTELLSNLKEGEIIVSTAENLLMKSKKYESKDFRQKIVNMLDTDTFNMGQRLIRLYALMAITRIGVHGRHMQPFNIAKQLLDNYHLETVQLSKLEKEKGLDALEHQKLKKDISVFEIAYIKESVLPTLDILVRIFPEIAIWKSIPEYTLKAHEILVDAGNKKTWDPEMCTDYKRASIFRKP